MLTNQHCPSCTPSGKPFLPVDSGPLVTSVRTSIPAYTVTPSSPGVESSILLLVQLANSHILGCLGWLSDEHLPPRLPRPDILLPQLASSRLPTSREPDLE
jgi:hypothetical protein